MQNIRAHLRNNKLCIHVRNSYDDILNAWRNTWNFLVNSSRSHSLYCYKRMGTGQRVGGWH